MAEINFELYNNTLIQQLVGPQDSHLRLLEKSSVLKSVLSATR